MSSRGSVKQRSPGSWSIVYDVGYTIDPTTGGKKRIQKWRTIRGSKREAQKMLTQVLRDLDKGDYVERTKQTLGEWLTSWLEKAVKPSRRASTYRRYRDIIANNIPATLKAKPVQELSALDLEGFYADQRAAGYAASTVASYHNVLTVR